MVCKSYDCHCGTKLLLADCAQVVPCLGTFEFIFADPPFNIGQDYSGYVDQRDNHEEFTLDWVGKCWGACDGVMALHGPDDLADLYLQAQHRYNMTRIAWVNWHYRFGQCNRSNWIDSRCHCLIFAKHEEYTWNPEDVLVDSDRKKYGDKRIHDTERGGSRLPGTVWGIEGDGPFWGRVQGNNKERRHDHPNQLPEVYLERLIRAYTNPGDRVLDPFRGSGTTAVVAEALGRKSVTIEFSLQSTKSIAERLNKGAVRI